MLSIHKFDRSLKITWLRRMLNNTPEWEEFAKYYKINRLLLTETKYHNQIRNKISNPFWKDVASSYLEWYISFKKVCQIPIPQLPIWGNATLNIPFNEQLFNKKIIYMHYLYKETGGRLFQNEIENIIGTKIYFTMYQAIRRAIPREWDRIMQLNTRNHNIIKPLVIEWITKDKKGGTSIRQIWNMCNREEVPISQVRWNEEYDNAENVDWAFSYTLPFICRLNAGV